MSDNLLPEPSEPDGSPDAPPPRRRLRRRLRALAPRVVLVAAVVSAVAYGGLSAWGYVFGPGDSTTADSRPIATLAPVTTAAATTSTSRPRPTTTTTTIPEMERPEIVRMPEVPAGGLGPGGDAETVLTYEYRLAGLHFDPGPVDGVYDASTAYAVTAVQKLYGFERTGRVGESTRFALSTFEWPDRLVTESPEPDRAEIDLDRQVMVVWKAHRIELITTVSTGNGRRFCGGDDGCQYATTPPGRFEFTWHHRGWRKSKLGRLYNPYYFNGGIAVHGYSSVPPYPASHGCTRIPMHVADYFPSLVYKGMAVYVLGTAAGPYGSAPGGGGTPGTTAPPTATTGPPAATTTTAPPTGTTVATTTTPTTSAATTAAPTTAAPTTAAPTTAAPTTAAPTTSPPPTDPPPTLPPD